MRSLLQNTTWRYIGLNYQNHFLNKQKADEYCLSRNCAKLWIMFYALKKWSVHLWGQICTIDIPNQSSKASACFKKSEICNLTLEVASAYKMRGDDWRLEPSSWLSKLPVSTRCLVCSKGLKWIPLVNKCLLNRLLTPYWDGFCCWEIFKLLGLLFRRISPVVAEVFIDKWELPVRGYLKTFEKCAHSFCVIH